MFKNKGRKKQEKVIVFDFYSGLPPRPPPRDRGGSSKSILREKPKIANRKSEDQKNKKTEFLFCTLDGSAGHGFIAFCLTL